MQVLDFEQGSTEWLQARLGIPTASNFSKLITSSGKKSTQIDSYLNTLVAESLMGEPAESFQSDWMSRGTELEPEARAWYEFQTDLDVQQVGFVKLDSGDAGASPDGLTERGGLELKCPKAETHVSYLRDNALPSTYLPQVQGCMWICERDTWDFASYHPLMPKLLITVPRDDAFIAKLAGWVKELNERKLEILEQLRRLAA
jgi:YqaJ-like viral recombinase domain